jgi:hypothetical protein
MTFAIFRVDRGTRAPPSHRSCARFLRNGGPSEVPPYCSEVQLPHARMTSTFAVGFPSVLCLRISNALWLRLQQRPQPRAKSRRFCRTQPMAKSTPSSPITISAIRVDQRARSRGTHMQSIILGAVASVVRPDGEREPGGARHARLEAERAVADPERIAC